MEKKTVRIVTGKMVDAELERLYLQDHLSEGEPKDMSSELHQELCAICSDVGIPDTYIDTLFEGIAFEEKVEAAIRNLFPEIEQHVKALDELFTKVEILTGARDLHAGG